MVYGTQITSYNYSYWGESKPTYNWGGGCGVGLKVACLPVMFVGQGQRLVGMAVVVGGLFCDPSMDLTVIFQFRG
jgi:hypothetical protein